MAQAKRTRTKNGHLRAAIVERAAGERYYSLLRPTRSTYVLLEGRVSVTRLTRGGRHVVTEVLGAGSVFGDLSFDAVGSDSECAEALTNTRALAVDSRRAKALIASDSELAVRFVIAMAHRMSAACARIEEFACRPVEKRIASAVLQIAGRTGRTAPVSHQFLADMAGTYRETATRVLGDLQTKNLLELSRRAIRITDAEALTAVATG